MHLDPGRFVKRQLTFLAVGAVVLMLAVSFDYRLLKVYAGMIYVSSLVLLVLVRTPFGTSVRARSAGSSSSASSSPPPRSPSSP